MQREIENTLNTYLQISVMVNLHLHVSPVLHFHALYIHMTIIFIVVLNLRNVFMNLSNSVKLILEALQYQNTNRQWLQLQMIIHYTYNYISIRLMLANFIIKYKINFQRNLALSHDKNSLILCYKINKRFLLK